MFLRECGAPPPHARSPGSLDISLVTTAGAVSLGRYKIDNECEFMACMGGGASFRSSSFPLPFSNAEPTVLLTQKRPQRGFEGSDVGIKYFIFKNVLPPVFRSGRGPWAVCSQPRARRRGLSRPGAVVPRSACADRLQDSPRTRTRNGLRAARAWRPRTVGWGRPRPSRGRGTARCSVKNLIISIFAGNTVS